MLTVEYKSNITYGSLAECGRIKCRIAGTELTFESPSAFSIYLKRLINPARKADDGWKTVKFEGKVHSLPTLGRHPCSACMWTPAHLKTYDFGQ